jgi:hypothetical protein
VTDRTPRYNDLAGPPTRLTSRKTVMSAATHERRDLHNVSVDFAAASEGLCGFTHMPSGRVCRLPDRHAGPGDLRPRPVGRATPELMQQRLEAESTQPHPKDL